MWYEAFYHHLRMEMDEYRQIKRSLRALKANLAAGHSIFKVQCLLTRTILPKKTAFSRICKRLEKSAYACPSHHNTVTRLKWLTALTVDPEAKSQMIHLVRKIDSLAATSRSSLYGGTSRIESRDLSST